MRKAARAIIIRDSNLLVMKRNKFGKQYYTLLGGAIEAEESPQQALVRELKEESGLDVSDYRLVFTEDAGPKFGFQYIYICADPGGDVRLPSDSIEAKISRDGLNTYEPMWLSLKDLKDSNFLSEQLKQAILKATQAGFPKVTKQLS